MSDEKPKAVVFLHHAPLTLRVDEMVRGEAGIEVARQVGEIPLVQGRNEVDPELWRDWKTMNEGVPLLTQGIVHEEKPKKEESDDEGKNPADR